jgi:hypothetical protein
MGTITRSLSNNITTGGVILPAGITNSSVSAVTSFANASGGTLTLLSTQTASNSATISFTTGLDSTYDAYEFKFINIHARGTTVDFRFNGSTDAGSNYNVTKSSSVYTAYYNESGSGGGLTILSDRSLEQSTSFQDITRNMQSNSDDNLCGSLQIYNPSSTTYVKHYVSRISSSADGSGNGTDEYTGGYLNTTSAINAIRFQMSSGNFDGVIKLYGLKKS